MTQSTLRQVLAVFETAQQPLSMPQLARALDVSSAQLDAMIQFWVRKGKIRISGSVTDCGTCAKHGSCPFVLTLPRTYELVTEDERPAPEFVVTTCQHAGDTNN